jgi:hypothetical protein
VKLEVLAATWVVCSVAACADLPPPGECGNGVHEPEVGEDCDGDSASCAECRLVCSSDVPCPAGYACGVGGVCAQPSGAFAYPATVVDYAPDSFAVIDVDGDAIGDVLGIADDHADIRFGSAIADLGRTFKHQTPRLTPFAGVGIAGTTDPAFPAAAVLPTPEGISVGVIRSELLLPLPTPALAAAQADVRTAQIACNATGCGIAALGIRGGMLALFLDNSEVITPCGATAVDADATHLQVLLSRVNDRDMVVVVTPSTGACLYEVNGDFASGAAALVEVHADATVAGARAIMAVDTDDTDPCQEALLADDAGYRYLDVDGCTSTGSGSFTVGGPSFAGRPLATGRLDEQDFDDRVLADRVQFWGGGTFAFPPGVVLDAATVVDVNRDGNHDVVGIDLERGLRVFQGVGAQMFQLRDAGITVELDAIAGADLDGDSFDDVVAVARTAELIVMFGGPGGLGPPEVFGFVTGPTPIVASSRTVDARLRADVLVLLGEEDGNSVIDFHANQNRSLAPLTPLPFGAALSTMLASVVDGAPADQIDVMVHGVSTDGYLQALIVPDAGDLFTTGDPFFLEVQPPAPFFDRSYGLAIERIQVGDRRFVIAMPRRAGGDARHALIVRTPAVSTVMPGVAPVELIPAAEDACRTRSALHLRPLQLDADPDDELAVVSLEQCAADAACSDCVAPPRALVHLLDLDADGLPTGPPIHLTDPARHGLPADVAIDCPDVAAIELGAVGPAGATPQRDEAVAACMLTLGAGDDSVAVAGLVRFHGSTDPGSGQLDIVASLEGANLPYVGDLAVGDVTGDGLDDVVIHHPEGKLGVAVQCPRHATEECQ